MVRRKKKKYKKERIFMYPLFIYPKNIDLISYRKDGKIMSDFNMIDN